MNRSVPLNGEDHWKILDPIPLKCPATLPTCPAGAEGPSLCDLLCSWPCNSLPLTGESFTIRPLNCKHAAPRLGDKQVKAPR
ncbi:hypothetical protein K443DRAFT_569937 [Laccaria amethystina LaAM-08-1]|uniref:Uncharacterized protein n=1 Tax=Laccaria amethystina LaAM-08-1 TaxID=1095629 RepID=A0A0C9XUE3_9AGAR|nr:hypothetical protein K443DRAFT_569937 [Laccaria amethystina LaAM-08-1]